MNEVENLKKIQNLRDGMISVYDECVFNHKNINYDIFKIVKKMKEDLDIIAASYISGLPDVQEIVVMEDLIIEPGQVCELHTNITCMKNTEGKIEINLEGYIPTSGFLALTSKDSDIGLRFYVQNNVPKEVFEKNDCGYHYCDPTTPRFFGPGVYEIKKGTIIGIMLPKEQVIDKQYQLIHERFNKVN